MSAKNAKEAVAQLLSTRWKRFVDEQMTHALIGYSIRVVAFSSVVGGTCVMGYKALTWGEETKPIAKRNAPYYTPIRLLERRREPGTNIDVYRFALPQPYDYTGHDVVSSVELDCCDHWLFSSRRFFTPISHPEQRGYVEFAIKEHNPGNMSHRLQEMKQGDVIWMTRWMKEFRYQANAYDEIGFVAANSGITPALQMLNVALADSKDMTKFSLLVLSQTPESAPFRTKLLDLQRRFPSRLRVSFAAKTPGAALSRNATTYRGPNFGTSTGAAGTPSLATSSLQLTAASRSSQYHHGHLNKDGAPPVERKLLSVVPNGASSAELAEVQRATEGTLATEASLVKVDRPFAEYVGSVDKDMILETMPLPGTPRSKLLICGPNSLMSFTAGRTLPLFRWTYVQGFYHGVLPEIGYQKWQVYKFGSTINLHGLAH